MPVLKFSPACDFSVIPYLPLNAGEPAELRFQIKNTSDITLTGSVRLYEIGNHEHPLLQEDGVTFPAGGYRFCRAVAMFSEGEHQLILAWKADGENVFHSADITVTANPGHRAAVSGSFLMLYADIRGTLLQDMTKEQWEQVVDAAKALGMRMLIIFATLQREFDDHGDICADYPSDLFPRAKMRTDAIAAILRRAEQNGQQVMIGLAHPFVRTPANVKNVMEELYALYGGSPAFYGWYSSYEVNMGRHFNDETWARWKHEWAVIRETANRLSPVKPIMTSPFCINERNTADMDETFLENLRTGQIPVDILMPQDMNGHVMTGPNRGYLTPDESGRMYALLAPVCREGSVHLWANCEAFDFDAAEKYLVPRYKNGGLEGEHGYFRQLETAAPHVEKVLTYKIPGIFTAPWQTPRLGGEDAVEMYEKCRQRWMQME
ncbi:MAG: DUF4434 domain-containing protein [Ruminococcaceae bacterium]|nr:DUF4434 domain-containing protein [Oscillospiraceae bacterium]